MLVQNSDVIQQTNDQFVAHSLPDQNQRQKTRAT